MAKLLDELRGLFKRLEEDDEGKKVFSYVDHSFQFEVEGEGRFVVKVGQGGLSLGEGGESKPDPRQVTLVETDAETLRGLMRGQLSPSEAFFAGRFLISGMSNNSYGYGLMRLFRRGQELNR